MFGARILRSAKPTSVASSSSPINSQTALLQRLEAAQVRETNQRKIFAFGLLLASAMTAFMGFNVEMIRKDLNDHMQNADERISALEDKLKNVK
ncbi:hypothetical protein HDU98_002854 [Podochytrium sp. JEL0797]|nr:hypothetical protein HDU98_002854 [Podochytrium sp. JEL0797]